jgi:hypothetical protein
MQVVRSGMGDLVQGAFVVPQNPLLRSMGLGDLINGAHFVVPQNPLMGNTVLNGPVALVSPKKNALKTSLRGLSCGTCAASSLNGMGSFDITQLTTDPTDFLSDSSTFGVPNAYVLLGAAALFMVMNGEGRARRKVARSDARVESIRSGGSGRGGSSGKFGDKSSYSSSGKRIF